MIQAVLSAAIAAFTAYMGVLAVPIIVLMAMMIIDYLSGMAAAWTEGACQARWAPGDIKKVGYMALIGSLMGIFGDLYERQSFKPCRY